MWIARELDQMPEEYASNAWGTWLKCDQYWNNRAAMREMIYLSVWIARELDQMPEEYASNAWGTWLKCLRIETELPYEEEDIPVDVNRKKTRPNAWGTCINCLMGNVAEILCQSCSPDICSLQWSETCRPIHVIITPSFDNRWRVQKVKKASK